MNDLMYIEEGLTHDLSPHAYEDELVSEQEGWIAIESILGQVAPKAVHKTYASLKECMNALCADLSFDDEMYKRVVRLETNFVYKDQSHMDFFTGTLTGHLRVVFTTTDRGRLFSDILGVDEAIIASHFESVGTINYNHKVASDTFNLCAVWVCHKFMTSTKLDVKKRFDGAVRMCQYLQYKFLTSRLHRHFISLASEQSALATYSAMSMKFDVKRLGSWGAALRNRAENAIDREGFQVTVKNYSPDAKIFRDVADLQGRIRSILKKIYGLHIQTRAKGIGVVIQSATIEIDGDTILRERTGGVRIYTEYLLGIAPNKQSFIRPDLVDAICLAMETASADILTDFLSWVSVHALKPDVQEVLRQILEHVFQYFATEHDLVQSKGALPLILGRLKNVYKGSRSDEPVLLSLRKRVEDLVRTNTRAKSDHMVASTRTAFMLYVVARALTMHHYAG